MPERDDTTEGSNGLVVKIPNAHTEIAASNNAIVAIEHGYERSLDWAEHDQLEFLGVLILIGFGLWQRRLRKQNIDEMKRVYKKTREQSRQPKLPLDHPDGKASGPKGGKRE